MKVFNYEAEIAKIEARDEREQREKMRLLKKRNQSLNEIGQIVSNIKINNKFLFKVVDKRKKVC